MKGSEKQVAWANEIRSAYATLETKIESAIAAVERGEKPNNEHEATARIISKLIDYTEYQTENHLIDTYAESLVSQGRKYIKDVYFVAMKMFYEMNLRILRTAIDSQDDAKYWIDRRF